MGNNQVKQKTHTYSSGNVYSGEWRGGKRHGKGTYTWVDGTKYVGDWVANQQEGYGVTNFPNGNVYEGEFRANNPDGQGKLRTVNGEVISGTWKFIERSTNTPNFFENPVGKYNLNVKVEDEATGQTTIYNGPASLHLSTGLVVLPGMNAPDASVMPIAVAIAGQELYNNAISGGSFGQTSNPAEAIATPVYTTDGQVALEQRLIDQEEQMEYEADMMKAVATGDNSASVAYGMQDPALKPNQPFQRKKINVLDPRNYF